MILLPWHIDNKCSHQTWQNVPQTPWEVEADYKVNWAIANKFLSVKVNKKTTCKHSIVLLCVVILSRPPTLINNINCSNLVSNLKKMSNKKTSCVLIIIKTCCCRSESLYNDEVGKRPGSAQSPQRWSGICWKLSLSSNPRSMLGCKNTGKSHPESDSTMDTSIHDW